MRTIALGIAIAALAGCYGGGRATRDVNASWRGRSRAAIEGRWGHAAATADTPGGGTTLTWTRVDRHFEAPSVDGGLRIGPGSFDAHLEATPGKVWSTATDVVATLDAAGNVVEVRGPSLFLGKGPPRGTNMRWGTVFGFHAGMGALDSTGSTLPSLGLYLGGMLGPRLGLVGTYAFVNGSDDGDYGMGMAWGIAAQYWPLARLWLRAGPAMVVLNEPRADARLTGGVATGASYALIRGRVFVLDLRLDAIAAPGAVFGSVGVGVNVN